MQFRSGTRRTAAAIGAAALGLVALSACEKPTPLATVSVGTNSVSSEAACYNDGKKLSQEELRDCIGESSAKKLTVHDGERIRVGVEPEIADSGWVMGVNGQGTMAEASKDTYRTFAFDQVFAPQQSAAGVTAPKKAQVTIVEVTKDGQARGVWQFTLNRAS
jgi:outer membrane protein assembly factor BamE (lipoprotein component of BamABCDE complex)